jgi:hypothetical protein
MLKRRKKMKQKDQWKIAGTLIAVFAVLVFYKAGVIGPSADDSVVLAAKFDNPTLIRSEDAAEIVTLLASSQIEKIEVLKMKDDIAPLTRNPFFEVHEVEHSGRPVFNQAAGTNDSNPAIFGEPIASRGIPRKELLDGMIVSGIFSTNDWSKAVISGEYLGIGDTIEGFTVVEIGKRYVVVEDHYGKESLTLTNTLEFSERPIENTTAERKPTS